MFGKKAGFTLFATVLLFGIVLFSKPNIAAANTAIDIEKYTNGEDADVPTGPSINVGDPVYWTYVVTNTGFGPGRVLNLIVVDDDQGVTVTCPKDWLDVGESMTCTAQGIATAGQYANIGTVVGTDIRGTTVSDSDPSHYYGVEPPPPSGGEGCTPGYWKQDQHLDSWVGYSPSQDYETVFGVDASFTKTLLEALGQGGGGEKALGRHAVAALLNAANPDVNYLYTEADVIAMVQQAYATGDFEGVKNLFAAQNEMGCPLN